MKPAQWLDETFKRLRSARPNDVPLYSSFSLGTGLGDEKANSARRSLRIDSDLRHYAED
jgi:hypothetical protein